MTLYTIVSDVMSGLYCE